MKTTKHIQIFKAGKHVASSGAALSFSEADLAATAKAYDPAKHEAPIVIGHPVHDGPAYGWVKSLSFADGLDAETQQVDPAFAEMVANGSFKKISASFYSPDSPSNPVPGVYYLRHVGFLGAQPPAVKGLRNPAFADSEKGVIEFADYDDVLNASLWRRLRDWMIGEKGLAIADNIIPDYQVASLEQMAQQEDEDATDQTGNAPAGISYSEKSKPKGDEMSAEQIAELAALKIENDKLKADQLAFAEADKKTKTDARHAEYVAFCEGLVKEGKLLPAHKDEHVAMMDHLSGQEKAVEFGEGDKKKPLLETFKAFLTAMPKLVEFKELASGDGVVGDIDGEFAAPRGFTVDSEKLATHNKAVAFAEKNKCDYITAVKAVENA